MKIPKFTPAEEKVVRLISLGLSTKEVARVLGKAVSTVDNQRTSAMRAAEINTATELVRVALKAGITTLDDELSPAEKRRLRAPAATKGGRKGAGKKRKRGERRAQASARSKVPGKKAKSQQPGRATPSKRAPNERPRQKKAARKKQAGPKKKLVKKKAARRRPAEGEAVAITESP